MDDQQIPPSDVFAGRRPMRPSEVFATRLRETRHERRNSQAELAQRMTDADRPMNKAALLRLERGERGLSLDEAVALAALLNASPAHMLSPPDDAWVMLTGKAGVDGSGVRNWLRYGTPFLVRRPPGDASEEDMRYARLQDILTHFAVTLTDAARGKDAAGVWEAVEAIVRAVNEYQQGGDAAERYDWLRVSYGEDDDGE